MNRLLILSLFLSCLLGGILSQREVHAAAPVYWYRCFVSSHGRACHEFRIVHPRAAVTGYWKRCVPSSQAGVRICVRYPEWKKPAPTVIPLNACIWPAVKRWAVDITYASRYTGIPATLLAAQIQKESGGDPSVSSAGYDGADVGLEQYGVNEAILSGGYYTYDPHLNILTGALIDRYLLRTYGGTYFFMLENYNGGPGAPWNGYDYARTIANWSEGIC